MNKLETSYLAPALVLADRKVPRNPPLGQASAVGGNALEIVLTSNYIINICVMTKEKETLVDTIWKKIKNNRLLAILIVASGVVIGIASFSESIEKLFKTVDSIIPDSQNTDVKDVETIKPSPSFENYFNKNFQVSNSSESDIVNLSKDDIIVDLSLNNQEGNLKYVIKKEKEQFIINPYNEYLLLLQNGGLITPLDYYWTPFDFQFPTLDFKVINNSSKTIFFTKAIVSVATSKPDSFPVLIMHTGYEMDFPIENIGWGKVYNCSVKFNLVTTDKPSDFTNGFMFDMNIGDFLSYSEKTSLSKYFETLGVNTEVILKRYSSATFGGDENTYTIIDENGQEKTLNEKEYEKRINDAIGPFKNGVAKMFGEISYEGINASDELMKEKLRFENEIHLGRQGAGAPAPPSFVYDVMFESNKTSYKKEIPISQAIKPNEFDRFDIKIAAPISSRHQFKVILFYNDNRELTIPNISLNYFMSKLDSSYITNDKSRERKHKW